MSEVPLRPARGWLRQINDFARATAPRPEPSKRAMTFDFLLAGLFLAVSLYAARFTSAAIIPEVVMSVPLAGRTRFPTATFLVLVVCVVAAKDYATYLAFAAVVIAGYSAAMHSRRRGAALLSLAPAGVIIAIVFWKSGSHLHTGFPAPAAPPAMQGRYFSSVGSINALQNSGSTPWRMAGVLVLVALVSIAIVGSTTYAGDRMRRLQADHAAVTRRALDQERSRIASELHDVVTHNVSVMIVQAGAARQVLADSPEDARTALLAVESSGRAAMTELRHLLGLLSPSGAVADDAPGDLPDAAPVPASRPAGPGLQPQPGLAQLPALADRMRAAGLPVELSLHDIPGPLPPGPDLAAFRIVQEALTNVIKHAGTAQTTVSLCLRGGDLVLEVADAGWGPAGGGRPFAGVITPGAGRGLLGMRERAALYGGELDAGPRPGGGWQVRARIPVDPAAGRPPAGGPQALGGTAPIAAQFG